MTPQPGGADAVAGDLGRGQGAAPTEASRKHPVPTQSPHVAPQNPYAWEGMEQRKAGPARRGLMGTSGPSFCGTQGGGTNAHTFSSLSLEAQRSNTDGFRDGNQAIFLEGQ